MRIAILEPYIEGIGGAQKVIAQYADYLQKKGHYIEMFTQRYDPNNTYKEFSKFKITLIGSKSKWFSPFVFMRKFDGFDVVIANDWPTHFAALKNDNVVWVCYSPKRDFYDLRDFYYNDAGFKKKTIMHLKEIGFKRLDRMAAKRVRKILPISKNIQERIRNYYGMNCKDIFYLGIDFKEFKKGKMGNYFISVGRLVKAKKTENIVMAMKYVKDKQAELDIIGDGTEMEMLKKLAGNDKRIKFLGGIFDLKKIAKYYSNARGLIYVPVGEDWGLTPLEAGASEIPVIGVNDGGLKETVVNGKTGFLLDNPSPENLAKKIELLMKDKKLAIKMGKEGKKHSSQFDWKKILPQFEKFLEEAK